MVRPGYFLLLLLYLWHVNAATPPDGPLVRLVHQTMDGTYFPQSVRSDPWQHNVGSPEGANWADCSLLTTAFLMEHGKYEFTIKYPNDARNLPDQTWRQSSNPCSEALSGYEAFNTYFTEHNFHGLQPVDSTWSWMGTGPGGWWWYGMGTHQNFNCTGNGCIPAAMWSGIEIVVYEIELWVRTPYDDCSSNPCLNGGVCNDLYQSYSCDCEPSVTFTGTHCEIDSTQCVPEPCENGGTCSHIDYPPTTYSCDCASGWAGQSCTSNFVNCATSLPCQNGGTCTDTGAGTYSCAS